VSSPTVSRSDAFPAGAFLLFLIVVLAVVVLAFMLGMPYYWVYHQHLAGKAMLAKAEYSKQVLVQDAKAREESAKSLAQAEVIRAEGVAKANQIIGRSLEDNEAYLHYLWLHNLEIGDHDVVYIPTEAGLPIFEAGGRYRTDWRKRPRSGQAGSPDHPDVPDGDEVEAEPVD
jgi:predicted Holliday junction resolvase-like endonuclease